MSGPVIAVVGRPNVGKSTLVNRIIGRRDAIVEERPGVTRDRTTHAAEWRGRSFTLVDTGGWTPGWEPERDPIDAAVAAQAEYATRHADLVLLVVDVTVGVTEEDAAVAGWLRGIAPPVLLVANKADARGAQAHAPALSELYALGLGEPLPVSALHGIGSGDLLDACHDTLTARGAFAVGEDRDDGFPAVALIGRPNVGKSSLLNRLAGAERAIVDERPGTTRDAVDTVVALADGRAYRFVDTAGLRRKARHGDATEYYSTVRTVQALDAADAALLVVDAAESVSEQEQRLARQVLDAGRAVVLVLNKWDLIDEERRLRLDRERGRLLNFLDFATVVRTSATTRRGVTKLPDAIDAALVEWRRRIPTGRLNAWLAEAVAATAPPMARGRPVRLRYATQVAVEPPTFRIFASGPVPDAYLRYLERRLREAFGFDGTPLDVAVKVRTRWEDRPGYEPQPRRRGRGRGRSRRAG